MNRLIPKSSHVRREIRVGARVVSGMVCDLCPRPIVIYPDATFELHIKRHAVGLAASEPEVGHRRRSGRTMGVINRVSMSSTGIEKRAGIKNQHGPRIYGSAIADINIRKGGMQNG